MAIKEALIKIVDERANLSREEASEEPAGRASKEQKRRRRKKGKHAKAEDRARPLPRPVQMTRAEMDKHRREGHVNYHPGCAHCVKCRALADQHRRAEDVAEDDDKEVVPTISADLCFMGTEAEADEEAGVEGEVGMQAGGRAGGGSGGGA